MTTIYYGNVTMPRYFTLPDSVKDKPVWLKIHPLVYFDNLSGIGRIRGCANLDPKVYFGRLSIRPTEFVEAKIGGQPHFDGLYNQGMTNLRNIRIVIDHQTFMV